MNKLMSVTGEVTPCCCSFPGGVSAGSSIWKHQNLLVTETCQFAGRICVLFHQLNVVPFLQNQQSNKKDKIVPILLVCLRKSDVSSLCKNSGLFSAFGPGLGTFSSRRHFSDSCLQGVPKWVLSLNSGSREKPLASRILNIRFILGEGFIW